MRLEQSRTAFHDKGYREVDGDRLVDVGQEMAN